MPAGIMANFCKPTGDSGISGWMGWYPRCSDLKTGKLKAIILFSFKNKCYKEFLDTCIYCLRPHNGWDIPHCRGLSRTHEKPQYLRFFWRSWSKHCGCLLWTECLCLSPSSLSKRMHMLKPTPHCDSIWR